MSTAVRAKLCKALVRNDPSIGILGRFSGPGEYPDIKKERRGSAVDLQLGLCTFSVPAGRPFPGPVSACCDNEALDLTLAGEW